MNTNYTLEQELIDREQLQADYDRCRETGEAELCWNCRELTMMEELDRNYGVCDECK
jgi:acetyl-CoA carboxylase beta subunit